MNANGLYNGLEGYIVPGTNSGMGNGVFNGAVSNDSNSKIKLLDKYPGAAVAYSFRKLSNNYNGPSIRVRRSNDNLEQDIFFDGNGDLDLSTLRSFVGSNSGFVSIWYNQSGISGRDFTQSSGNSQPVIVNSGIVVTSNLRPAIDFDGSQDTMVTAGQIITTNNYSAFCVLRNDTPLNNCWILSQSSSAGDPRIIIFGTPNSAPFDRVRTFVTSISSSNVTSISNITDNVLKILYAESAFNRVSIGVNGAIENSEAVVSFTPINRPLGVGWNGAATPFFPGLISEIILYEPNVTGFKTGIESDINNYYKIY
jgi:hypothetical protein